HTPYRDNVIHYNWHWFHRWGTGEICNNGTHEIDVARWALGVDYPVRVTSVGGRYHFDDDWEFPDTQEACFEFAGGKTIIWQGQSCNGLPTFGRDRGTAILGTTGSVSTPRAGCPSCSGGRARPPRGPLLRSRPRNPARRAHVVR